jgi:phenylalanyl-tRNA synthetase beta chain
MVSDAKTGTFLGIAGELKRSVARNLKLPAFTAGFEIGLEDLQKAASSHNAYAAKPRFPSVQQDVSLKVPADTAYQRIFEVVETALNDLSPAHTYMELSPVDIYQPEGQDVKHVTLRLRLAAYDRTLKTEEVNTLLDQAADVAKETLGAERI